MALLSTAVAQGVFLFGSAVAILLALWPSIRALRSPIPGPFLSKLTIWYSRYYEAVGRREEYIERIHQQYGDVVFVSPCEIAVRSADAIRDIYGSKRLDKPILYWLEQYGVTNMVSTQQAPLHLARRKVVSPVYSAPAVNSPMRQKEFNLLMERLLGQIDLEASRNKHVVDIYPLLRWLATDIMTHFVFGRDVAMNTLENEADRNTMSFILPPSKSRIGNWLDGMLKWYPVQMKFLMNRGIFTSVMRGVGKGETGMHSYINRVYRKRLEKPSSNELPSHMDLLIQKYQAEGVSPSIPHELYVHSDSADHFFAGCITSADASSWLIWQMAQPHNRECQLRLRHELHAAGIQPGQPADMSIASKLAYLDICLKETLRCHPPIPFSQVRQVKAGQDVIIAGHKIPAGTMVGAQHYSVHRQPDAFPDPERWDPSRWEIEHSSPEYVKRYRHFWPFGTGQRMCIGFNIAWSEIRHVAAAVFSTYDVSLSDDWLDEKGRLLGESQRQHMFPNFEWEPIRFTKLSL